jgi:hypothetical protein
MLALRFMPRRMKSLSIEVLRVIKSADRVAKYKKTMGKYRLTKDFSQAKGVLTKYDESNRYYG